jgi:hypothetical protein
VQGGEGGTVYVTETSSSKSGSGAPVGAIVGGVVGGVVALVLLGVLIFCCRRRRKGMTEQDFLIDDEHQPVHQVQPFAPVTQPPLHPPQPFNNDPKGLAPPGLSSGYATSSPSSHTGFPSSYPSSPYSPPSSGPFSASSSSYEPSSPGKLPPPTGPAPVVEHAVDAGAVPPPVPAKEILPPMYDPSWSGGQR